MQNLKSLVGCKVFSKLSNTKNSLRTRNAFFCKYSNKSCQEIFDGVTDRFKGITVEIKNEDCNQENFTKKLQDSLHKWKCEGNRCVWFKVGIRHANYVPVLAQKGFNFHHAREDFVMMYKWLPEDCGPNLPPAAHTNLGVGAMVFNTKKQILAISEKHYEYPHWKLPGGYVEKGEDIIDAAIREVKEETGIDSTFLSLITLRHSHNMMYGNSDIYVLLMMRALTEKFAVSTREVKDCKWMDVEEYSNHPHVHEFNRFIVHKALEYRNRKLKLNFERKRVKWALFTREMNFLDIIDEDY